MLSHSQSNSRTLGQNAALRLLKDVLKHLGWKFTISVALTVASGAIALLPSLLYRYFALNISADDLIPRLLLVGGALAGLFFACTFGSTLIREWIGMKVEVFLRARTLDQIHRLPLETLDKGQRGDLMIRMSRDLLTIELFFVNSIPAQIRDLTLIVGSSLMFIYHSGVFALIPMGTAIFLMIFTFKVHEKLAPYLQELRQIRGEILHTMIESLEGIRTIRSHQSENYVENRFHQKLEETQTKTLSVSRRIGLLGGQTEFTSKLLIVACLCADAWLYHQGRISLSSAFIYPFLTGIFYDSVAGFTDKIYHWNQFFNETGRLAELIYPSETGEAFEEPLAWISNEKCDQNRQGSSLSRNFQEVHSMEFRKFSFGYSEKTLISPFDFTFSRNELWALMGSSGCGKSTMLEVLAGVRAAHSLDFRISSKNGTVLGEAFKQGGRLLPVELCAYVEQHPYLFEGTLRENLILGSEVSLSDLELISSLEALGLSEFLTSRAGLETRILERGRNLSVGQRYRVGLCRALLLRRPFLLLDEPFAALDEESIRKVTVCLNQVKRSLGILMVTHFLPEDLKRTGIISLESKSARVIFELNFNHEKILVHA